MMPRRILLADVEAVVRELLVDAIAHPELVSVHDPEPFARFFAAHARWLTHSGDVIAKVAAMPSRRGPS